MRAYQVTATEDDEVLGRRFGGTQAEAKQLRDELMEKFGVKKSACSIEEVEIPTAKPDLLEFINGFMEAEDYEEDPE